MANFYKKPSASGRVLTLEDSTSARTLSMTGNITLTYFSDLPVQFLNVNGAARQVTLDTASAVNGASFVIKNTGPTYNITIKQSTTTKAVVTPNSTAYMLYDGTNWNLAIYYSNVIVGDISNSNVTISPGVFSDGSGTSNVVEFAASGSTAYGYLKIGNGTASSAKLEATGTPTNIDVDIVPKGTGKVKSNGNAIEGGNSTLNIGYLNVPQNSQSTAYTLVLTDAGKHIYHPSSDATARTFTIPANASVAYPIGTAITFTNMSTGAVTIAITTDTLYLAGAGTTGSRTLARYGTATALKISATEWLISGTNLT